MLGVSTLIIVMAGITASRRAVRQDPWPQRPRHLNKIEGPFHDYDAVTEAHRRRARINAVMPLIEGQVMVSSAVQATGALVRGMSEAPRNRSRPSPTTSASGRSTASAKAPASPSARGWPTCCASASATHHACLPARGPSTFGTAPRTKPYAVKALFEMGSGIRPHDGVHAAAGSAALLCARAEVDAIEVVVNHPEHIDNYLREDETRGRADQSRLRLAGAQRTFFTVLEVERNVMFIILSLIVLVAALNIISGLMMLVKDKGRDVAILRTMGATRGAMMRVFLITGASIGVVGTLAGLMLGIVFCLNIEIDPRARVVDDEHHAVRPERLLSDAAAGRHGAGGTATSSSWRWPSPCSPRFIPPGALPRSIP